MSSAFAQLGVPEPLCARLSRRGIAEPFPIQAATLPDALAGRDIAGKAPTGSGKTLAFGLVVAARAAAAGPPKPRRPRALVLVPTRELAAQVQRELQALIDRDAGPVVAVYGGVGYGPQRRALAKGVSAVVACPGRLEDLVATGDVVLDRAEVVVLDEADRMADMGFLPAVRRLVDQTPERRQTLLFSATLDGDVEKLVQRYQNDPARHEVAGVDDEVGDVTHLFWRVPRAERVRVAAEAVTRCGPTVVFCRTRHGADRVAKQLGQAGVKAVAIHGRRTQGQRDQALAAFTRGKAAALVATDVAARGIHVDGVACVVHFDLPADPKDYVHRSGRTGRAGADGVVVALVTAEDGDSAARMLLRQLGRTEPIELDDPTRLAPPGAGAAAARAAGSTAAAAAGAGDGAAAAPTPGAFTPHPDPHPVEPADSLRSDGAASTPSPAAEGRAAARRSPGRTRARRRGRERGPAGVSEPRGPARPANAPATTGTAATTATARRPRPERERDRERGRTAAGTVTVFHARKGYGFISRRGGGDVFVHVSNLAPGDRVLRPGQKVRFEVASGRRGEQAVNVRSA